LACPGKKPRATRSERKCVMKKVIVDLTSPKLPVPKLPSWLVIVGVVFALSRNVS